MKKTTLLLSALTFCFSGFAMLASAEDVDKVGKKPGNNQELGNLLSAGEVDLSFRYRYEFVDQDNFDKNANASTVRTRLTLQSGDYRNFNFLLEVDDVREIIWDNFNAGAGNTPNRTQYPVVADVKGTEVNQGYIAYTGFEEVGLKLGRQTINLDNQRFIGGVGWRQQQQTFDSFRTDWHAGAFTATYGYVWSVRTIFGDRVPAGKDKQDGTHLVNIFGATPVGKLVGYYYRIDSKDRGAISNQSFGARLTGKKPINDQWKIRYEAEFATQSDVGKNPANYTANYWHLDAGGIFGIYDFGLGWEVLEGDRNSISYKAFRTPLATLHAFNGWADRFLATPAAGLDDRYLKFKATPGKYLMQARVHTFEAQDGSTNFGSEVDLRFGYKFNKFFRGDLFFADFQGKNGFPDTTKFWLMATVVL